MATTFTQPDVYLWIAGSAIAKDDQGEIVETVEFNADGTPDWTDAAICDDRGIGGQAGYDQLVIALNQAEANAKLVLDRPVARVSEVDEETARNIEDERLGEQAVKDGIIGRGITLDQTPYPDGNAVHPDA
jgi:hypothetical protein